MTSRRTTITNQPIQKPSPFVVVWLFFDLWQIKCKHYTSNDIVISQSNARVHSIMTIVSSS
jgi:hypothetical protein